MKNPQRSGGQDDAPCPEQAGGPRSLLWKWLLGFSLAALNTWAQVHWMSHNSELGSLNGTRCTGSTNTVGAEWTRAFYFLWSLKYGWRLLVLASPPLSPPSVSLLPAARGAPAQAGICRICRICRICSAVSAACSWSGALAGAAVPQPAAYLGARPAAARPPQSFRLHKHLGPTRGWIAAW